MTFLFYQREFDQRNLTLGIEMLSTLLNSTRFAHLLSRQSSFHYKTITILIIQFGNLKFRGLSFPK